MADSNALSQTNDKIQKILEALDEAICEINLKKVKEQIEELNKQNQRTKGQNVLETRDFLSEKLVEIAQRIVNVTSGKESMINSDKVALNDINIEIGKGFKLFEKVESAVKTISERESIEQQEKIILNKKSQRTANMAEISAIKEANKTLATNNENVRTLYVEPIQKMLQFSEKLDELENLKKKYAGLDLTIESMRPAGDAYRNQMSSIIAELKSKGADISAIESAFNTNPGSIDAATKSIDYKKSAKILAQNFSSDNRIPVEIKDKYLTKDGSGNYVALAEAKDMINVFDKMKRTLAENASRLNTLRAENDSIGETIKMLEKEKELKGIAINDDGTEKSDEEIINAISSNSKYQEKVDEMVSKRFDYSIWRHPFKRFGARMAYYKGDEKGFKAGWNAFWNAFSHKTETVKQIAAQSASVTFGKGMSEKADNVMKKREKVFKDKMREAALKEFSDASGATKTVDDISRDAIDKAFSEMYKVKSDDSGER